jgi:membrane-associated phospholipid phosphatase
MQKILDCIAKALSITLYPLLLPTYGIALYMTMMHQWLQTLPTIYIWVCILGTMVLTTIIPVGLILLLWKRGSISSLHIEKASERTTPYIYAIICFAFWSYFVIDIIQLPNVWTGITIGATLSLAIVTIINCRWKISAHSTGMGGLLGGICSISLYYGLMPTWLIICMLILSLMLMYARLHLNAHTPLQVICGYLLGILCTFIPNLIIHHA